MDRSQNIVLIDNNLRLEQQKNRIALRAIFDSIRFCGQAGIAFRGHGNEKDSGNLARLIGRYSNKTIGSTS